MEKEQVENQEAMEVELVEEVEVEESLTDRVDRIEKKAIEQHLHADQLNQEVNELVRQRAELFQQKVEFELQKNGLEKFVDLINPKDETELRETIEKLNLIVNDIKVANSYVPKDNAKADEYNVALQKGDTKKMIGSKLANLFK